MASEVLDRHSLLTDERFRDAGFDSLTSLELRNHRATYPGRKLPLAIVFDNLTPRLLAATLSSERTANFPTFLLIGQSVSY
ncbi:acyl carrier protein [Rhodococcus marinonascens]|uniref:acyl carrier protein n=1 Tax=Rhodococcus marinonascens TaxID=38311 RepID=UPI001475E16C